MAVLLIVIALIAAVGVIISIMFFIKNIRNYKKGKKTKNRAKILGAIFGVVIIFLSVPIVRVSAMFLEIYLYYYSSGFYYNTWYEFYNDDSIDFDLVGFISEKNDFGESYYVLRLMEPLTFSKDKKKVEVTEIQLILDDKMKTEFAHLDYDYCHITGTVFFASEKQHHTKVILVVEAVRPNG